ncbi:MAG: RtcB family protein [Bacilli bacterium]
MFELDGKYAGAKVFTDCIEEQCAVQIKEICDQHWAKGHNIRIMPDTHAGKGAVIGFTATFSDKVVSNIVGVDIGCGMLVQKLDIRSDTLNFLALDDFIRNSIPHGMANRATPHALFENIDIQSLRILSKYKALLHIERIENGLGSLGGGNHFIELNQDAEGYVYLVIHTGSRNLGKQVAEFYQNLAFKKLTCTDEEVKEYVAQCKANGQTAQISEGIVAIRSRKVEVNKDLAYLEGEALLDYLQDMKIAQKYASENRRAIAQDILAFLQCNVIETFESVHNYIDLENKIIRKGACSAQKDEKLIIPINMRDGSIIAVGKGNADWNYSAPHGAGRVLSRRKAKELLNIEEFTESMKSVWTRSVSEATLDEAPNAYKRMEDILNYIDDTVDVLEIIKPIYNFKSS